jgi:outer membrane lipoprotein-sorting protein
VRNRILVLVGLLTVAILPAGAGAAPDAQTPTARQILQRVAKTYARCTSYRDTGTVATIVSGGANVTQQQSFSTAFVRPDRFRFEYSNASGPKEGCVVWRKGKKVRSWWSFTSGQTYNSLGMAVAGATGVSGGSAHTIPSLLMKSEIGGRLVTDLKNAKHVGDEMIGGSDCFRVDGTYVLGPMSLWVDKKLFVIRKAISQGTVGSVTYETTTTYEPEINSVVAAKMLDFNPPKQNQ